MRENEFILLIYSIYCKVTKGILVKKKLMQETIRKYSYKKGEKSFQKEVLHLGTEGVLSSLLYIKQINNSSRPRKIV